MHKVWNVMELMRQGQTLTKSQSQTQPYQPRSNRASSGQNAFTSDRSSLNPKTLRGGVASKKQGSICGHDPSHCVKVGMMASKTVEPI